MKLPTISPQLETALRKLAAGAALLALLVLAAAMPGLSLKPGVRYLMPQAEMREPVVGLQPLDIASWFDAFLIVSTVLIVIALVIILRSPETRRKSLRTLSQILLYGVVIALVYSIFSGQEKQEQPLPQGTAAPAPNLVITGFVGESDTQPAELSSEPLPGWATYLLSLVILLAIGLGIYGFWRATRPPQPDLAEIARLALDDLAAGRNWEDVVIRCYADMSAAASQRRSLNRPEAMTPREFALRLEAAGLPAGSVRTLTSLFEKARYGRSHSSADESQAAMACLAEILQAVENPI